MKQIGRRSLCYAVARYWYLCMGYVLCAYLLAQIIVWGSDLIADTTDRLFAGEVILLKTILLLLLILMCVGGLAALGKSLFRTMFGSRVQRELRDVLVEKLVKLPLCYFDSEETGALMNKLLSDMQQVEDLFSELFPELLMSGMTVAVSGVYIGRQNVCLFAVTMVCYPALLWIADQLTKRVGKVARVRRQLIDELEHTIYDAVQGILIGRTYDLYELQKQRIDKRIDEIVENEVHRTKVQAVAFVMDYIVRWIPQLICYLFCLYEVNAGRLSVGSVLAYVMLLERITKPLGQIPWYLVGIREHKVSLDRIREILKQQEERTGGGQFTESVRVSDRPSVTERQKEDVIIAFENVSFGYSEGVPILQEVYFQIKRGSKVAFIGESGSGKSTVVKLLCGLYKPWEGQYRLYGHDISEWDVEALRGEIGLVSQDVFLFPGTIAENVSYGKRGASYEEIVEACKRAGAHDFIMRFPLGYDTEVGERGAKLSGGQQQRLSIARAFLKDAPILLLDEPTSAVDTETERGIQEALKKVMENRTVITIAHRLSTVEDVDETYLFCNGKISEVIR